MIPENLTLSQLCDGVLHGGRNNPSFLNKSVELTAIHPTFGSYSNTVKLKTDFLKMWVDSSMQYLSKGQNYP